ncbi:hypothetical protein GCM10011571_34150 [Marinithermofilum abyssi]|uniref:DUF4046 domain-containing protein n=1 Tax=Marinithermofilum abyssi TaxID=1571185 RepID=A0A8J2YBX1_9BACL|nr:DUF4046 domain-containing protein [Marinithermofilum abyssi]GGE29183.1 hypothetical protein GCM10011571_34150 [Marinithermofilum abyssi]
MEKEAILHIYQDILSGRRARFPNYLFEGEAGKQYLAYMTRYLIENYLNIEVQEIPQKVQAKTLWDHRLRPGTQIQGWNFIDVIENAYPGRFYPWEFQQVPHGYWQGTKGRKRAIEAVRYVIEEKGQIPFHEIPRKINSRFFKKHRLCGVFSLFGDSPYQVINAVYPGQFQPWQFAHVPMNCWKDPQNIKKTMDWFLFDQIGFCSYQEAILHLRKDHFYRYRLTGFLQMAFDHRMSKVQKWLRDQI